MGILTFLKLRVRPQSLSGHLETKNWKQPSNWRIFDYWLYSSKGMGRGGQEGFVLSFPQVDNNLRKALKLGVAEEKENTLFAHTYWLKF